MKLRTPDTQPGAADPHMWVGGEAAVGSQAERHVRRREARAGGLFTTMITLAFIGGLTLGGALAQVWWSNAK